MEEKRKVGRPKGQIKSGYPTRIGGKATKLYQTWQGIIARCHNPNSHIWKYYGARGIAVCPEWLAKERHFNKGFNQFCLDMGEPFHGASIDRIDNDGHYCKENCRWATMGEQANNRRQGGKKNAQPMSLASLCRVLGVPYHRTYFRLKHFNWPYSEAFREKMPPKTTSNAS
jgi:hypothetical protein